MIWGALQIAFAHRISRSHIKSAATCPGWDQTANRERAGLLSLIVLPKIAWPVQPYWPQRQHGIFLHMAFSSSGIISQRQHGIFLQRDLAFRFVIMRTL